MISFSLLIMVEYYFVLDADSARFGTAQSVLLPAVEACLAYVVVLGLLRQSPNAYVAWIGVAAASCALLAWHYALTGALSSNDLLRTGASLLGARVAGWTYPRRISREAPAAGGFSHRRQQRRIRIGQLVGGILGLLAGASTIGAGPAGDAKMVGLAIFAGVGLGEAAAVLTSPQEQAEPPPVPPASV